MRAALLCLIACAALAADNPAIVGVWKGQSTFMEDGEKQEQPATITIRSVDGTAVTGSATAEDRTYDMKGGKLENNRLTFNMRTDEGSVECGLTIAGNDMKGECYQTFDDGEKITITVALKRVP